MRHHWNQLSSSRWVLVSHGLLWWPLFSIGLSASHIKGTGSMCWRRLRSSLQIVYAMASNLIVMASTLVAMASILTKDTANLLMSCTVHFSKKGLLCLSHVLHCGICCHQTAVLTRSSNYGLGPVSKWNSCISCCFTFFVYIYIYIFIYYI